MVQGVRFLRDQLRALETAEIIGTCRQLRAMLFERTDGNDHHIRAAMKFLDLGPRHMRQIILYFLFVPKRVGLGNDNAGEKNVKGYNVPETHIEIICACG